LLLTRPQLAVLLLPLVALLSLVAGCASSPTPPTPPKPSAPAQTPIPGGVIGQAPLRFVDPKIADVISWSHFVTYVSSNGVDDGFADAAASIYVPKGVPPQDGFPVVALGRPVTGTGQGCGSSASASADPSPTTITAFLEAGYVVAVPDYMGLGLPSGNQEKGNQANFHPFLDSATVAENMTDAVRATRNVVPQASARWVAVGTGQGGQAAWAANELADDYGQSYQPLNLRGAVSISPTADIQGLADAAAAGTLSTEQKIAYITYLDALSKEHDDFNLDDYRRGIVAQNWDLLLGCESDQAAQRSAIIAQMTPDDLRPATPDALTILHGYLQKTNLPQGPTSAPMLVVFGTGNPLIPAEWTQRALDRACAMGDVIAIQKEPDDGPAVIDTTTTLNWIAKRFTDTAAPNDCPAVSNANPASASAPAAVPPPPPPAPAPPSDNEIRSGTSLIHGWLPITIQAMALMVLVAAVGWRSRRWRLRWLPIAGVVGLFVAEVAYWYVDYEGWGHDPPRGMWVWIALTGLALAVVVLGWPSARWWRRVLSILAVPLAAMSAASVLNASLGYLPTVRTAWEMFTGAKPPDQIDESTLAAMVREGARPTRGTIVSVKIPKDQSGFIHRDELVYLPPAWFESSPPPRLPAVMMIGAEMGGPQNWLPAGSGDAQRILDEFARKHGGTTPVVVFPDSNGAFDNDTECVNGLRGNAADHLTKEVVPYIISRFGTSAEPSNWGLVGWSAGGTCALTLSVMHPELFSAFVDLDGQLGPNAGGKEQTTARLFGGNADAWAAFDPKSVVEAHDQYHGMSAWFGVSGHTPTVYRSGAPSAPTGDAVGYWDTSSEEFASIADQLCQLLSGHGIECAVSSYSGAHDFVSAGNGLAAALPWLAGKIGTPGVPRRPLPGGPPPA
jgi:S-formylglutathione hydrolase FrmB